MTSFSRPKNVAKNWVQTPHHLREADIFAYDRSFNTLSRCHVFATLDNCRKPSSDKKLPFCLRPCSPSSMPCLPGPGLTFMAGIVVEINFFLSNNSDFLNFQDSIFSLFSSSVPVDFLTLSLSWVSKVKILTMVVSLLPCLSQSLVQLILSLVKVQILTLGLCHFDPVSVSLLPT